MTETTQPEQQLAAIEQATDDQQPRDTADLGEGGKKAIQTEREARKAAEERAKQMQAQLDSLKPVQEQMEKLRAAFGSSPEQASEDIVATLQREVSEMRRDNLVNSVARQHGIIDEADIAFLRGVGDADQMTALAQRLAVAATPPPDPKVPGTPAPDAGQGSRPSSPQSVEDAEYEKFFPSSSK